MRRLLVVAFLLAAAPAHAAPQPLALNPNGMALAGDSVLVAKIRGRAVRVTALPGDRPVFAFDAPAKTMPTVALTASPQRAAATVFLQTEEADPGFVQAFSGPPLGPWAPLGPLTDTHNGTFPWLNQLDGERLFTLEFRGDLEHTAYVVRDPDPHDLPLRQDLTSFAEFAGDLVAYPADERHVVVANWRTGARQRVVAVPTEIEEIALRPDGRVAIAAEDGLYDGTRRLAGHTERVAFAGERIVFSVDDRLRVVEPDGNVRAFGVRTERLDGFVTDERRVAWIANGCLLVEDASASAARAPGPGPCPRSEISFSGDQPNPHLGRTLPVVLGCVAAPRRCTGTLDLTTGHGTQISRPQRFAIPAGHRRRYNVRLTERGYRALRRAVARQQGAFASVQARTDDGDQLEGTRPNDLLVLPRGAQ